MSGHGGVDGELDEAEDDLDLAGAGASAAATPKRGGIPLDELLDRLDTLGDLDDLGAGGVGGLATGIEIIGDGFVHGPDDLLDSFEPARDLAEGVDVFDDFFLMLRRRNVVVDDDRLYGPLPGERLAALRELPPKAATKLQEAVGPWPPLSPAAVNAWLLLVTTKPPQWRDPLTPWPEAPLSVGGPHPGFLYPDPIGFWAEIRRWSQAVVATRPGRWETTEAVAVSGLVHVGEEPERLRRATRVLRPRVVLFLDEPAWQAAALEPERTEAHHVPDPHREGKVYQGFWGRLPGGTVVGKSPQHPTMHRLYGWKDMEQFLDSCPT